MDKWEEDEFADLIWRNYISPRSGCWYLNSRVPTMGECRGKAILFRRFGCKDQERASTYGIDANGGSIILQMMIEDCLQSKIGVKSCHHKILTRRKNMLVCRSNEHVHTMLQQNLIVMENYTLTFVVDQAFGIQNVGQRT